MRASRSSLDRGRRSPRVMVVGCGKIGGSMVNGWLLKGTLKETDIVIVDPAPNPTAAAVCSNVFKSLSQIPENVIDVATPDVVVLAVKSEIALDVFKQVASHKKLKRALLITTIPGKPFSVYQEIFGHDARVIKCTPNIPASIGAAITGLCPNANTHAREADRGIADTLLRGIGSTVWVKTETELEAVSAVSSSGPAFVYQFIESMQNAAEALGLSPEVAKKISRQTVLGSAALAATNADSSTEELKSEVVQPGGPTAAGLDVYKKGNLKGLALRASQASLARSLNS